MKKTQLIGIMGILIILNIAAVYAATTTTNLGSTSIITMSLVNQDPDPAIAGDVVEIRVGIENTGGDSFEDMMVELVPEYPFTASAGENLVKEAGTILGYQNSDNMKIIKFNVRVDKDATAGTYEFKIKYYEKGSSVKAQKTLSIDIQNQESAEIIYIDQIELIPGKMTPLKFTINNVGSSPLRDITFQWENEDDIILPVGSDNTKYIKYIDIGESVELKFDVIASANADPDLYKLDLALTYDNPLTDDVIEINTKAGVYVGGATDFDVAYSGSNNGESTFSIANIGSVSATSVTVKIPKQEGWKVIGSSSVIIGNLNEGDYTIASFTVQSGNTNTIATGTTRTKVKPTSTTGDAGDTTKMAAQSDEESTIKLDIMYTDSRGNRNTVTKEVQMESVGIDGTTATIPGSRMSKQKPDLLTQTWNSGKWILLGIAMLVVIVLVRKNFKKGRQKDPNYSYKKMFKDIFRFGKNKKK